MSIETVALPSPLYGCASRGCAEEVSHSSDDLFYHAGKGNLPSGWPELKEGFYCVECIDHYDLRTDKSGYWADLASVLGERGLSR